MKAGCREGVDISRPSCALLQMRGEKEPPPRTQDCGWAENIRSVSVCCFPLQAGGERVQQVPELG